MLFFSSPHFLRLGCCVLLSLICSCTYSQRLQLDKAYGISSPANRLSSTPLAANSSPVDYWRDVKPVLDKRCVVCHGCYDAPCQLKLSAYEGIERGAHKDKVYVGARLVAANLTRLFEDAQKPSGWREKGFYPVLNERQQTPQANAEGGVMYQMLALKQQQPLVLNNQPLPDSFDLSLNRKQSCPKIEEFPRYAEEHPTWGMPYALPGLSDSEHHTVSQWLQQGAPYYSFNRINPTDQQAINQWELFFNGDSLKQQLVSRYLYEHLYLSAIYFNASGLSDNKQFYRLVRSATPPPLPVDRIATRRPFDDPNVARVYYRLLPIKTTTLNKTQMPYLLDQSRQHKWQQWFINSDYDVDALPGYDPAIASNPFKSFEQLPQKARYRFLLDEAQHTIMGFIKGPVCRGQVALNVIDDHFWVAFINPDDKFDAQTHRFLVENSDLLRLPAEKQSTTGIIANWQLFSYLQKKFLAAKSEYLNTLLSQDYGPLTLDYIWDGDQTNPNYGLTIFRHFDSATVVKGFVGQTPKTAWLIDYSLLERIHYLLVAGFDVYGNSGHQLNTRLYMDFLRMEGEFNFLAFMPKNQREQLRDFWYREAPEHTKDFVYGTRAHFEKNTGIAYQSDDPKTEFFNLLQQRSRNNSASDYDLNSADIPAALKQQLLPINHLQGRNVHFLSELSFIRIRGDQRHYYFTLINNRGHANVAHPFKERSLLLPEEDYALLVPGLLGSYPNTFFDLPEALASDFVKSLTTINNQNDYRRLMDKFGLRRSAPNFWTFSDALQQQMQRQPGGEGGLLDYNRLENR